MKANRSRDFRNALITVYRIRNDSYATMCSLKPFPVHPAWSITTIAPLFSVSSDQCVRLFFTVSVSVTIARLVEKEKKKEKLYLRAVALVTMNSPLAQ